MLVDRSWIATAATPTRGVAAEGRAAHQAPEVDGVTVLSDYDARPGTFVRAVITGARASTCSGAPR